MQKTQNMVLKSVRKLGYSVEDFNDVERVLLDHPELDDDFARAYRDSGYLDISEAEFKGSRWRYDLEVMLAITNASKIEGLRSYCVSTIREFYTGGLRFVVNLVYYRRMESANGLNTHRQLVELYEQLVRNHQTRCSVSLQWLEHHFPEDVDGNLERITPHTELWFSIIDQVQPSLGIAARYAIRDTGLLEVCSTCGDPAEDYWLVNSAEAMPGVPSLRLCIECVEVRRARGEILKSFSG